jgi:hypothetical protein
LMIQIGKNRHTSVSRVFSQNLLICE